MPTIHRQKKKSTRTRLQPEVRRQLIVEVAFKAVADDGLEGLRTLAGTNSATLHHYFPSKEDLVASVALHLEHRLRSEKSPSSGSEPALGHCNYCRSSIPRRPVLPSRTT